MSNKFNSISARTLLQMAIRITIVVCLGTAISYLHVVSTVEDRVQDHIGKFISERVEREKINFEQAVSNHATIKNEYVRLYRDSRNNPEIDKIYQRLLKKDADGVSRNRDPHFDGKTDVGLLVGKDVVEDHDFRTRMVVAEIVTKRFGLPYHHEYQDTYFTFKENAIALYWPEVPDWVKTANANLDITKEIYHTVSAPAQNPARKTAWTSLFYDSVSEIWMVTASTPIYDGDTYLASVHHDLMLNEVFQRVMSDQLKGTDIYYIVRGDGRLILHPKYQDDIKKHGGDFDIMSSSDELLKAQFQKIKGISGETGVIESPDGSAYLAVAKIAGPDWHLVTSYPKSHIRSSAASSALFVLFIGVLSLLLEVTVLYFVLKKQISEPLLQLIQATKKIASGRFTTRINLNRKDELGELASSFNSMTIAIEERDKKLELHALDLEMLVVQRTRELDEQKALNLQASKMSTLGEMAGGIAHEINTPLATIKLLTSQVGQEIHSDLPDLEKLASQVQKIESTADRVAKIVRGLRTFARDGSADPMQPSDAKTIVDETLVLCQEKIHQRSVPIKLEAPNEAVFCYCRSVQISQVLLNLINNATDAVSGQSDPWIEIRIQDLGSYIEFRVIDSGLGIPTELREKIFNPFFTTKGVGEGMGMGLSISLGIVRGHAGELRIDESSPNTCFVLKLPSAKVMAA